MKSYKHSFRGFTLVEVIVAIVLASLVALGVVMVAGAIGQNQQEANTMVQENSYRTLQSEVALSGASPSGMSANPLAAIATGQAPMPTVSQAANAGSALAGAAGISAYVASPSLAGRSGAMGYRISSTGAAIPAPVAVPLQPPSFSVTGSVPVADFTPNLTGLIVANASNPAGTVYRYTIDGSTPTGASPIWNSSVAFSLSSLPSTVKAAAFNSDPDYSTSAVATDNLSALLTIVYGRSGGGNSTGFLYSDVSAGTNGITLTLSGNPTGTTIYYTYDGSTPNLSSPQYTGTFQIPLGSWTASMTLNVIATTSSSNVTATPLTVVLSPIQVPLPSVAFGTLGGSSTDVLVPVTDTVAGVVIQYAIGSSVTGTSPTTTSGASISVTAP